MIDSPPYLNRSHSREPVEARPWPVLGAGFAIGGLALAGLPPFGTYLGKEIIEQAAACTGLHWLPWLFLLTSALTGGAVLRAAGGIFGGWGADLSWFSSHGQ